MLKQKLRKKKLLSVFLAVIMTVALLPVSTVSAAGNTMTFGDFVKAVQDGNGTFNGNGVVVKWVPDEKVDIIHRVQEPNAQYQMFDSLENINISNVNFEYVPADIPNHSDGWSGLNKDWTKEQIRNAEFQFLNSGNVTLTNCTFEKIIVSPYGQQNNRPNDANRTVSITGCAFNNVYDAYAVKDIYPATVTISGNTFDNCSGAIYFEGNITRKEIAVTGNTFNNIDQYASSSLKENYRGVIQFSAACVLSDTTKLTISQNEITGNYVKDENHTDSKLPVIRQICNLGAVTIDGWTPGEAFSVKIDSGKSVTLPDMPSGTVNGVTYTFKGWAPSAKYTDVTDISNADSFLSAGSNAGSGFYYAVWEAKCTVTYTDGVENEEIFADQVTENIPVGTATPEFNGTPKRDGYVFTGWTPEVAETVTASAVYTAVWSEDANGNGVADDNEKKYTVTYTDGVENEEIFADQVTENILSGTATPEFNGTPKRDGYEFTGWTPEVAKTVTGDAVYTAEWKKLVSSENPSKPTDENNGGTNAPETGDNSNMALWFALLFVSGTGLFGVTVYNRKKKYGK
ncbi:InlB B-repeat-containing protein [Massilistercora timonensis]|uniref:InlB B-repeat-containing protein n=1 Tax=Massilistercora timonensis TaxID=2086584 RepID=UPI00320BB37E